MGVHCDREKPAVQISLWCHRGATAHQSLMQLNRPGIPFIAKKVAGIGIDANHRNFE